MRGRRIVPPALPGLRPTPAKVREALFSMLGEVHGWRALDLFAGSGIIGLEALSRGAARVVAVERARRAALAMRRLADSLALTDRWQVLAQPVQAALAGPLADASFDLVFADPPYRKGEAQALFGRLAASGVRCRWLVIEEAAGVELTWPADWLLHRERRYGDTRLWVFRAADGERVR